MLNAEPFAVQFQFWRFVSFELEMQVIAVVLFNVRRNVPLIDAHNTMCSNCMQQQPERIHSSPFIPWTTSCDRQCNMNTKHHAIYFLFLFISTKIFECQQAIEIHLLYPPLRHSVEWQRKRTIGNSFVATVYVWRGFFPINAIDVAINKIFWSTNSWR